MRTIICLFFLSLSLTVFGQTTENEVRQQIDAVGNEVQAAKNNLRRVEQNLAQKQQALNNAKGRWNAIQAEIKTIQQRLGSVQNSLDAAVAHIDESINSYKAKLQQQQSSGASQAQIKETQDYIRAYENMKQKRLSRNELTPFKERLEAAIKNKEQELEGVRSALETAIQEVKSAEELIHQANFSLSDAQVKLAEVLTQAPDMLVDIAPPHLQHVAIKKGGSTKYEAEWGNYSDIIDQQIAIIKKGIEEQKSHLEDQKKAIDAISDELIAQHKITQEKLDAYVDEAGAWGGAFFKTTLADLTDAGISIARNFKEMGPYAFAYEALWRVGVAGASRAGYTGPMNPQWDVTKLPTTPNPPTDYTATAKGYGKTILVDQLKSVILDATKVAIGSSEFGMPGKGIKFSHNGSYTANMTSWKGIKDLKNNFVDLVRDGKFWVVADEDLRGKWMAPVSGKHRGAVKSFYDMLKRNPGRIVEEIKGSFNKQRVKGALLDVVQSVGIQKLKDWADSERLELWSAYLIEDNKRESLRIALEGVGDKRRENRKILEALGLALQELIKEKEEQSKDPTRYLKTLENDKLSGTSEFTMTLTFSGDITVESVTLGGKAITGTSEDKVWTGTFDLVDVTEDEMAQLLVKAQGKLTKKELDDPLTTAKYKASNKSWTGYERITDQYHKVKLKSLRDGASIVLLFDCSGSMGDNDKMKRAIEAGQEVLTSAQLASNDEVALMAFYDCYNIRLVQPFTSDLEVVKEKMKSLSPASGTPFALAVEQAALYMESAARTPHRKMIVLTDGGESCGGNEYVTMERVKEFNQQIRKEIID